MEIALCGKPSCGKSSFFKAATLIDVKIASYPFTTIEPNTGIAYVTTKCPCVDLKIKCDPQNSECKNGVRFIPVKLWDIAGLVPDAHLGKGRGNKFLNDIIRSDVLIHVVDASGMTDAEGNAAKDYDPSNDVRFLEDEIDMWFEDVLKRNLVKIRDKKRAQEVLAGIGIKGEHLELVEKIGLDDISKLARELRKVSKPIIVAANKIDIGGASANYDKMKEAFKDVVIVPCSAESEIALRQAGKSVIEYIPGSNDFNIIGELNEKQKKALEFIREHVLKKYNSTGVQICLNKAVFEFLQYITVYPVENENKLSNKKGNILPDAHLLPKGSTALDLAYKIHQDIGKGFIGAIDARTKKRIGADHELKDGDIIKIQSAAK